MKKILLPFAAFAALALASCSSVDAKALDNAKRALEGDGDTTSTEETVEVVDHEYITLFNKLVSDDFLSITNGESAKEGFSLNTVIKAGSLTSEGYTFELNYNVVEKKTDEGGSDTPSDPTDDSTDSTDPTDDSTDSDSGDEVLAKLRHGGHGPKEDKEGHDFKDDHHHGHHHKDITRYEGELTVGETTYAVKGHLEDENELEFFFEDEEGVRGKLDFEASENSKEFNFVYGGHRSLKSLYSYEVYTSDEYSEVVLVEATETSEVVYGLAKASYEGDSYLGVIIFDGENETYFLGKIVVTDNGTTLEEVTFDDEVEDDDGCSCDCPCCQDGHGKDDDFDDDDIDFDYDDFDDDFDDYDDFDHDDHEDYDDHDDYPTSYDEKDHGRDDFSHGGRR